MTEKTIDPIATYDAKAIRRLLEMGEPLSTTAAQFGYTPIEALELLNRARNNRYLLES